MSDNYFSDTAGIAAAKTAPAAGGILYAVSGMPWAQMAAAATFFYILLQGYFLLRREWRQRRERKRRREYYKRHFKPKKGKSGEQAQDNR